MPIQRSLLIAAVSVSAAACDRVTILQPEQRSGAAAASRSIALGDPSVYADNVEQLYAAVNDAGNAGAAIILAPGTYILSPTSGGVARPNGGRLELQPDMSLAGMSGDRSAVVIDMSLLPLSSFNVAFGKTGGIRLGRGSNSVEWLTIVGNPNAAASIETDLADSHSTQVTVSHVRAHGSIRGIDARNIGAPMSGRSIVARFDDNEFFGGNEGFRLLNLNGTVGAQIDVTMSGNRIHDNANGCVIEHNRASSGSIHVRSSGDRFEHNALGCLIGGGLVAGAAPGVANGNSTSFEAYGDAFVDNTLTVSSIDYGGVLVLGAETPGVVDRASHNTVTVTFWGTKVSGNQNIDFQAFGARATPNPSGISGIDNRVTIALHGVSKQIDVDAVNSSPFDPTGTNTVTIIR